MGLQRGNRHFDPQMLKRVIAENRVERGPSALEIKILLLGLLHNLDIPTP